MFMNCTIGGVNNAFPDVCATPTPTGPLPVPYPNFSNGKMCNPSTGVLKVLIGGMPAMHLNSQIPVSNGNNAGIGGGVVSGIIMGSTRFTQGSRKVMVGGLPATRLTSMTAQNGSAPNCVGATLAPAQVKVAVLQ